MNDDWKLITTDEMTLERYPCGLRAGDIIRLTTDLQILDHNGAPTGEIYPAGENHLVLFGNPAEPNVIWLGRPNGEQHTWDETVLATFELTGLRDSRFRT